MGEKLIKPYEISVWEDKLADDGSRVEEIKLAVIGSDTMTGLNRVYDPVFNKKINGEKTLSFSLRYKYFDPYSGNDGIVNPFAGLLINERKVKLHYNNEWHEFIVKDHTESSDGLEWTYTCTDAFVLELSKNGYDLTFDAELNNNQGTARELAKKVLKNTDWRLGGVDNFKQLVAEPIYNGTVQVAFSVLNTDTNISVSIAANTKVYIFYSYIKNKDGKFVQFIKKNSNDVYEIVDSNNVITATNYRITRNNITITDTAIKSGNTTLITIGEIESKFQANRLAYNQLTTYDPVMERTVDRFKVEGTDLEIYKYSDYEYTTSNVITNFITNGNNFNYLEDGSLQGWNPYTDQTSGKTVNKLELVTQPEFGVTKALADLSILSRIEGYLKIHFNGITTIESNEPIYNTVYNSGIENNASFINSISKGDKFVFRYRAGSGNFNIHYHNLASTEEFVEDKTYYTRTGEGTTQDPYVYTKVISPVRANATNYYEKYTLSNTSSIRAIVAKYTQDASQDGHYYKHISYNDIILDFSASPTITGAQNIIRGGHFEIINGQRQYIIDNVPQVPSSEYIYIDTNNNNEYVWDNLENNYERRTSYNYLRYRYITAEAQKSISKSVLTDPKTKIGIFLYHINSTNDGDRIYYLQDAQLTRYIEDKNGNPVLLGNIPTATSTPTNYYYLKPSIKTSADKVITYKTIEELAQSKGYMENDIQPLYNENSEKNLSISASQSNCFNILQTIAETFECWIDLVVKHNSQGYITYSSNGKINKFVYLRNYIGIDNQAGFKYGINLNSIERTVNSDEIVTKLIVNQSQSDYVDEGYVSIASAPSNLSGESYILNFDYYYSQNLLNRTKVESDKNQFIKQLAQLNKELQQKEKQQRDLENSLVNLESKRNVYTELIATAEDNLNNALDKFKQLTGRTYNTYRTLQQSAVEYADSLYIPTSDTKARKNKKYYRKNGKTMTEVTDSSEKRYPKTNGLYEVLISLTEEDTVLDVLGEIYTCSSTINNYSGLLTNIEQEYWNVRTELRGSENYKVNIWVTQDAADERHVFIELNDYLPGVQFTLGGVVYNATLSKKYFDITTNATSLKIEVPTDYKINSNTSITYTIKDKINKAYRILPINSEKGLEDDIEDIYHEKEQLSNEFNNKYRRFIQEGTWNSTDYIDSEKYYLDALQVSNTSAQPIVSYSINVVEVSQLEGLELYSFNVGDKSYIEDTEFFGWANVNGRLTPAREEVIVSEVEWHLDRPEDNIITVQNYKTRFEDLFQRIAATVQTVQYNEAVYAKMGSLLDANGTINQNVLLDSLNRISGQNYNLTSDGSVVINGDQILVRNLTNPSNCVILNSEGLRISSDGGQTWRTAIDGQGINIGAVYTGTLNTQKIIIGSSENPSFRWDKSGISAYRLGEEGVYDLKTYVRYDEFGLYGIQNGANFKADTLQDVLNNAYFGVTWDGFFIKNSYEGGGRVEITSENDFRVLNIPAGFSEEQEKIKIGALEWGKDAHNVPITDPEAEGATSYPTLYGIRIKNNANEVVMKTGDNGNLEITGKITATSGEIGGMTVTQNTLHMNHTIFKRGVGIYSDCTISEGGIDQPLFMISDENGHATFRYIEALGGALGNLSVFDTITVGYQHSLLEEPTGLIKSYDYQAGTRGWKIDGTGFAEFANAKVRGEINAGSGNFYDEVTVGLDNSSPNKPYIIIDGARALLKTSNYSDGASYGWMINSDGDAVFNNITARGAIKTAVFEYAEIQAVGGLFIFRPSSIIKKATRGYALTTDTVINQDKIYYSEFEGEYTIVENPSGNPHANQLYELKNLILKIEKPLLFAKIVYNLTTDTTVQAGKDYYEKNNYGYQIVQNPSGNPHALGYYEYYPELHNSWCKISNYISDGSIPGVDVRNILLTNGLTHVYRISNVQLSTSEVTLENGWDFVNAVMQTEGTENDVLAQLEGAALVDMGRKDGSTNYGIGINSSDNTVNLPARAISLFETIIDETKNLKVTYDYRGILGTLPELNTRKARSSIYGTYMAGTQGIYTDNMYIGDSDQYLAFYTDNLGDRHLKISAKEFIVGYDPESGAEINWSDEAEAIAESKIGLTVSVQSSIGTSLKGNTQAGFIYARVTKGNEVIDPVPINITGGVNEPTIGVQDGDYFVKLSNEQNPEDRTAKLEKYNGTSQTWEQVSSVCSYVWAFTDANGHPVENPPYQDEEDRTQNQFIYINEDLVNKKINISVKVDFDDGN